MRPNYPRLCRSVPQHRGWRIRGARLLPPPLRARERRLFELGTTGASWQTDPALAYISTAWELEYATCAKLVNYPDTPWDEQKRRA